MFVKVLRRRSNKESSKKLRAQLLAALEALHTRESSRLKREAARFAELRIYGSVPPPQSLQCCCHPVIVGGGGDGVGQPTHHHHHQQQFSPPPPQPLLHTTPPSFTRLGIQTRRNSSASMHSPIGGDVTGSSGGGGGGSGGVGSNHGDHLDKGSSQNFFRSWMDSSISAVR